MRHTTLRSRLFIQVVGQVCEGVKRLQLHLECCLVFIEHPQSLGLFELSIVLRMSCKFLLQFVWHWLPSDSCCILGIFNDFEEKLVARWKEEGRNITFSFWLNVQSLVANLLLSFLLG